MILPRRVVGVEQTDDDFVEHKAPDYRPLVALAVFTLLTIAVLVTTEVTR